MGDLFQYLVPLNLAMYGSVFAAVYLGERRVPHTGWLAIAYAWGTAAALLDISRPHNPQAMIDASDLSYICYWSLGAFTWVAMAARFGQPLPWPAVRKLAMLGLIAQMIFGYLFYRHALQELAANGLMVTFLLLAAWTVRTHGRRGVDTLVSAMFVGIALSCVIRVGGMYLPAWLTGTDPVALARWHDSAQLFTSAIAANVAAVGMLVMAALDVVAIYRAEATTDALTGLLNRRGLAAALAGTGDTDQRLGGRHMIMIDLDHFKQVNDRFGHQVGDAVLRRIARALADTAAPIGVLARLGGEEFIIVTHDNRLANADGPAARIWLTIRELPLPEAPGMRLTASIGVTQIAAHEGLDAAFLRADRALYRAKHRGRDQIVSQPSAAA